MSWEAQGRQEHGRFGSGTSGIAAEAGGSGRELGAEDVAQVVAAGAAVFLPGSLRRGFEQYLDGRGAKELAAAIPVWVSASGMGGGLFHAEIAGAGLDGRFAAGLQDVGRLIADARSPAELRAASARLAGVVAGGGEDWRYWLNYARDQAVYAAANDRVGSVRGSGAGVPVVVVRPEGAATAAAVAGTTAGVGASLLEGGGLLAGMGPWGWAAAALLGVGAAGYLYYRRMSSVPAVASGNHDDPGQVPGELPAKPSPDIPASKASSGEPPTAVPLTSTSSRLPPCITVSGKIIPVGTIAFRPVDTPRRPQHGIEGPHHNLYQAQQNPKNERCFWKPVGAVSRQDLPANAIPIEPFIS